MFFKKKLKKICLIKIAELDDSGKWGISYYCTIDGAYVTNSASSDEKKANLMFQSLIENKGLTKIVVKIKEENI